MTMHLLVRKLVFISILGAFVGLAILLLWNTMPYVCQKWSLYVAALTSDKKKGSCNLAYNFKDVIENCVRTLKVLGIESNQRHSRKIW